MFDYFILMYSNLIASVSNVIWVGANAVAGNESAWKDLDVGGSLEDERRCVICQHGFV